MINQPSEKDQVNMIIKNILPAEYNRMSSYPIVNFKQLCNHGKMAEDAIYRGERMQATFKKEWH